MLVKLPFVSVIMPIRNEIDHIDMVLNALVNQDYGLENFELLIADGLSDDGTYDVIKYYSEKYNNIKLLLNFEKIVPTGFNKALSISEGEIVTRVDGHSVVDEDFIKNSVSKLIEKGCSCVGGSIQNISFGYIANSISIAQSSIFGVGGVAFRQKILSGKYVDTLAFGSYKRKIFDQIGGYDEELVKNQDDEFNFRLIQHGEKIWLDPSINSKYFNRSNYKMLFFQYFYYGFYKIRVFQKRNSFASFRHLVPMVFVLSIIIAIFLSIILKNIILLQILITSYFLPALIFAVTETKKYGSSKGFLKYVYYPPLIIISFIILHISYGIGFIFALYKFRNKWHNNKVNDNYFRLSQK